MIVDKGILYFYKNFIGWLKRSDPPSENHWIKLVQKKIQNEINYHGSYLYRKGATVAVLGWLCCCCWGS